MRVYTQLGLAMTHLGLEESSFSSSPYQRISFSPSTHSSRLIHSSITIECLLTSFDKLGHVKIRNGTHRSRQLSIWPWNADWNVASGFSTDPLSKWISSRHSIWGNTIPRPTVEIRARDESAWSRDSSLQIWMYVIRTETNKPITDRATKARGERNKGCTTCMPLSLAGGKHQPLVSMVDLGLQELGSPVDQVRTLLLYSSRKKSDKLSTEYGCCTPYLKKWMNHLTALTSMCDGPCLH